MEAARISTIQTTLNDRLTTAATAGDTALTDDITTITDDTPEVAVVILADTGADPLNYPYLVGGLCVQSQPTSFVWHQKALVGSSVSLLLAVWQLCLSLEASSMPRQAFDTWFCFNVIHGECRAVVMCVHADCSVPSVPWRTTTWRDLTQCRPQLVLLWLLPMLAQATSPWLTTSLEAKPVSL